MSPAPKYRARTCNVGTEMKGVGSEERLSTVETVFDAAAGRIESTGMADEADGAGG